MVDIDANQCAAYCGAWESREMGHVYQRVKLAAERTVTVRMLVDTGATYSVISDTLARAVGIKRLRRAVPITLADGRRVRLDAGTAIFRIGAREAPATLLVGDVAEPILGVETLEGLGLTVDPRRRRLAPSRHYAVRLGAFG
jgi:clan AA aspartic protease